MKKILIFILCVITLSQAEVLDKISVIVGKNIILESEIKQMVMQAKMYDKTGLSEEKLRKNVEENLISNLVLYNVAQNDTNIVVEYNEIEKHLEDRINAIIENVGGEDNLKTKYRTSVAKLKNDLRPDIKQNLFIQKLQGLKLRKLQTTRSEVSNFFNRNNTQIPDIEAAVDLSQLKIDFGNKKNLEEIIYKKALKIRNNILNDSLTFEDAASKFSSDNSSKEKGGDLGMQKRGTFVADYERVAFNLEKDQISKPVKTEFGYHLIKLLDKQGNKNHTSHILFELKTDVDSDKNIALSKITLLRDSIINKKMSFEECVKKYSTDEKTRLTGGMIGNMKFSDLDENYRKSFKLLKSGDISEPFKQDDGYYIYKILDKQKKHKISIGNDYNILEQMALSEKKSKYLKKWIDDLKKKVYIEVK